MTEMTIWPIAFVMLAGFLLLLYMAWSTERRRLMHIIEDLQSALLREQMRVTHCRALLGKQQHNSVMMERIYDTTRAEDNNLEK